MKYLIILLLTLHLYAQNQEENINTHNPNNLTYQTTNPEAAVVFLIFEGLFHSEKFFDTQGSENKKGLKKEFEYLDLIDKNTREISK